eukprot:gene8526-9399_t
MSSYSSSAIIPPDSVVLVSKSETLFASLQGVVQHRVISVEALPPYVLVKAAILDADYARQADISWVRRAYPTAFIAVYNPHAAFSPLLRMAAFDAGANMVAHDPHSIVHTLCEAVLLSRQEGGGGGGGGIYSCPYCQMGGLSATDLYYHAPAYHINWPPEVPIGRSCPICRLPLRRPLQVHLHEDHCPTSSSSHTSSYDTSNANGSIFAAPCSSSSSRSINQLLHFALCMVRVRIDGRSHYLLVQEFGNAGFWCPGGGVDVGETISSAAKRECLEEAGVAIELKGILSIEVHNNGRYGSTNGRNSVNGSIGGMNMSGSPGGGRGGGGKEEVETHLVRMRVIYYAEPVLYGQDGAAGGVPIPKSSPDFESAGACWTPYEVLQGEGIKLRGSEPRKWSRYLEEGGSIYPLSLLNDR